MTTFDTRDASAAETTAKTDIDAQSDTDPQTDPETGSAGGDDRPKPGPGAARPQPGPARARVRVPTFGLSVTQLLATGLAAVTATFAASYLGVAGTVIGAAIASVLTAVGNAVYSTSLRTTRDRVREVVPVTLLRGGTTAVLPARAASAGDDREPPTLPTARPARADDGPARPRLALRRVALVATTVFLTVLAVVTGVELVAGRPLSDLLRGDSGHGTSVFGGTTVKTRTVPPTAPTVYVTVTPKVVVTTPTYTRTASPATTTTTPASGASSTPTTPSATPSTSGAPSSSGSRTP